jgi:hypothetical protein
LGELKSFIDGEGSKIAYDSLNLVAKDMNVDGGKEDGSGVAPRTNTIPFAAD